MIQRDITLANGQHIAFSINDTPGAPSFFLLGIRKSGSSILNSICGALAKHNGMPLVDVAGAFFNKNIHHKVWEIDPAIEGILAGGNVYGGFRQLPAALAATPFFKRSKKLLLVRDPRDALVSEYFTLAYSHSIPPPSTEGSAVTNLMMSARDRALSSGIDGAVKWQCVTFKKTLENYVPLTHDPNTRILRYEDVILDKRRMIAAICEQFGWSAPEELVTGILGWADVVPGEENPKAFVRRVVPGDHKVKLKPETIAELNTRLSAEMAAFGYT